MTPKKKNNQPLPEFNFGKSKPLYISAPFALEQNFNRFSLFSIKIFQDVPETVP